MICHVCECIYDILTRSHFGSSDACSSVSFSALEPKRSSAKMMRLSMITVLFTSASGLKIMNLKTNTTELRCGVEEPWASERPFMPDKSWEQQCEACKIRACNSDLPVRGSDWHLRVWCLCAHNSWQYLGHVWATFRVHFGHTLGYTCSDYPELLILWAVGSLLYIVLFYIILCISLCIIPKYRPYLGYIYAMVGLHSGYI